MLPSNRTERQRSPTQGMLRWSTRLTAFAVISTLGVTVFPAQATAPISPLPATLSGMTGHADDRLVASLKLASATSPSQEATLAQLTSGLNMPARSLRAYRFAEAVMQRADPTCRLDWSLLAAIGHVESDHGRHGNADVRADGTSTPHILGPALDGSADVSAIPDTDDGRLDTDDRWDRAVGPMQFIPSTWTMVGSDADDDGVRDPHDIDDAAVSTALYLCAGEGDLGTTTGQRSAVYRYNHSDAYVDLVLRLAAAYARSDSIGLSLPTAEPTATPAALPTLEQPVGRPAHPASPPRARTRDLPWTVRQAVSSLKTHAKRSDPDTLEPGIGTDSSATVRSPEASSKLDGGDTTRDGARTTRGNTGSSEGSTGSSSGDATGNSTGVSTNGTTGNDGSVEHGSRDESTARSTDESTDGDGSAPGRAPDRGASSDDSTSGDTEPDDSTSGDTEADDPTSGSAKSSEISGVLQQAADGSWSVGSSEVDFGAAAFLESQARDDFDGTDGIESNLGELKTLAGSEVTVHVSAGNVVQLLNGRTYR
jgi:membrane-bound lytic murein transglycosylase B